MKIFLFLILLTSPLHAHLESTKIMAIRNEDGVLKKDYQLSIRVLGDCRSPETVLISSGGTITSRYAGIMKVAGSTPQQIGLSIRQKLMSGGTLAIPSVIAADPIVFVGIEGIVNRVPIPTSMSALDDSHAIKPNDLLSINIVEHLKGFEDQRVAISGEISAGYHIIQAAGLTHRALAYKIKAKLEQYHDLKNATVFVRKPALLRPPPKYFRRQLSDLTFCEIEAVVVYGKVAFQAKYELLEGETWTVSDLLKLAGGHTSNRPIPKVKIVRQTPTGERRILVNSKAVFLEQRPEYDIFVRDHDVIIVE